MARDIATVTIDEVVSTYSGRSGKCACGCSGTHRYMDAAEGSRSRGYAVDDDEVSPRSCAIVLGKIKRAPADQVEWVNDQIVSIDDGSRMQVAYLREADQR